MAPIWRIGFTWTGFSGSPGRTVFYGSTGVSTAQVLANDAYTLLNNILNPTGSSVALLPAGVRIAQDPFADEVDPATADQVGRLSITPNPDILGVGTGNWAAPAGASITWSTAAFVNGRRVRGRTYLVPLAGVTAFQTDGTLATTFLSGVVAAITVFINGASEPVVWHRPTAGGGGADGAAFPIITGQMKDKVSILTSRRD